MTINAIKYPGKFTNRAGMRRLASRTPIPGAIRDWVFGTAPLGEHTVIEDIVDKHPLTIFGPKIVESGGKRVLRGVAADDEYADDETLPVHAQPFTLVLRARMRTVTPGAILVGGRTANRATLGITSDSKWQGYAGTSLVGANADTTEHTFFYIVNNTSSIIQSDVSAIGGASGTRGMEGLRFFANSTLTSYADMDLVRAAFIPYAIVSTERLAILAQLAQ